MKPSVRVRGVYSTALTKLFKDLGFTIVEPSQKISERFTLEKNFYLRAVEITDRPDRQAVIVKGEPDQVNQVIEAMRARFLDMILRPSPTALPKRPQKEGKFPIQAFLGTSSFEVEFPSISKTILDQLRAEVVPTISCHHKFRIIAKTDVDHAEEELTRFPQKREEIELRLKKLIYDGLQPGQTVRIEHVKPEGQLIQLTPGQVRDLDPEKARVTIRREFRPGRYDGLGITKEVGDYAITDTEQSSWTVAHSYYSREGKLKGNFFNINTPVEFYPDRIRYVDLHVDVVRWPDGRVKVIDRDLLGESTMSGYITQSLKEKAEEVVQELMREIGG